jgi:hypothetical protein
MAVPAGAVYLNGIACTADGAVYVTPAGTAAITGGVIKLDDGTAGAPSYSFASNSQAGFYRIASGAIGVPAAGNDAIGFNYDQNAQVKFISSGILSWSAGGTISGTSDVVLSRDGAGQLALKGASNAAAESRVYAGNGGFISQVKSVTESLTIAAAPTTVGATSIPAGAILLGVAVRVTTVIPTAATFTITTTVGGTTLNTAAVSTAANSTDPGTAAGASYRAAATTVTITPNLTPGAATGVVRLQYYYLQVTPPTS